MQMLRRPVVRFLAAVAVAGGLTACGENGPSGPFDPAGTTADVSTVQGMFTSESFTSFSAASSDIDAVTSGALSASIGAVQGGAGAAHGPLADAPALARKLAAILPGSPASGFSASSGNIPATALGKTFVYSTADGHWVVSDRTGAPTDGVRFVLYAVDPLTHQPVTPLSETGYVDVIDHSGTSSVDVRVVAVSGTTTFIDYRVTASGGTSGGTIRVQGFISDLTDRADFDLKAGISFNGSTGSITLDYDLQVPTRDITIQFTLHADSFTTTGADGSLSLLMQGPHGKVEMNGNFTATGGTLAVKVNGAAFATVTLDGNFNPTVTGSTGEPLTDQERQALEQITAIAGGAFEMINQLLAPANALISL